MSEKAVAGKWPRSVDKLKEIRAACPDGKLISIDPDFLGKILYDVNAEHAHELAKKDAKIELLNKQDEEWNREATKWQALAQERLIGTHFCPEWDEMKLVAGIGELGFAACSCKPYDPLAASGNQSKEKEIVK